MKYLFYFKENANNFKTDIVLENDNWIVVLPKSPESCSYWLPEIEIRCHPDSYVLINKKDDNKYNFDFYRCHLCQ